MSESKHLVEQKLPLMRDVLITQMFLEVPDIGRNGLSNNRAMNLVCAIGTAPW